MAALAPFGAPLFKLAAPGENADIFEENLRPSLKGYSRVLVTVQLATSSVFNMIEKTLDEAGDVDETLVMPCWGGVALTAGIPYNFEVLVHSDFVYNFQVSTDGVISCLKLALIKNG